MKQTISETIRRKRMEKGLTQQELAQRLNVSFQAVSKWERGVNLPDILLIPTLCAVLGITADELLDMPDPKRKSGRTAGRKPMQSRKKQESKKSDTSGGTS